jgi:hypothetical protein
MFRCSWVCIQTLKRYAYEAEKHIHASDMLQIDWARFVRLHTLQLQLWIDGTSPEHVVEASTWTLERLAQCHTLVSLDLTCAHDAIQTCNAALDLLGDLPHLDSLTVSCKAMNVASFERFCACSGISRLVLAYPLSGKYNWSSLQLHSLPALRNLRHLVLGRSPLDSASQACLKHISHKTSHQQLQPLYQCVHLETLAIAGLMFDLDIVHEIDARMPHLKTVHIELVQ